MNNSKGPTSAAAASDQNTPQQNRMIRHMPSSVGVSSSSLTTNTTSTSAQTTELSAAITFLGEEALLQACDILVAQSEALFGTLSTEKDIAEDTAKILQNNLRPKKGQRQQYLKKQSLSSNLKQKAVLLEAALMAHLSPGPKKLKYKRLP